MEHQTIRWVRAADEGGVDPGYFPAQSRGRGLNVEVVTCQKGIHAREKSNYEKCIKLEMEMKKKNKNIVQIDYNDFIETLKASSIRYWYATFWKTL